MVAIPEITGLEPEVAAGILARTALGVDSDGVNPASHPRNNVEKEIRARIVARLFSEFGSRATDSSAVKRMVLEYLDDESEKLAGAGDSEAALARLSATAALPNDLYEVSFSERYGSDGDPVDDRGIARETIRRPDYEQDFGPKVSEDRPSLISLFGKWYNQDRAVDRFLLIVAGSRVSENLIVHHIWRVYPSNVNLLGAGTLVDVFKRFADVYGVDFSAGNWKGRFLYHALIRSKSTNFPISISGGKYSGTASIFAKAVAPNLVEAAFGIAVNLTKYNRDVRRHLR